MSRRSFALVVFLAFAGCAGPADEPGSTPTPTASVPPPRELLAEQGNNNQCTEVLTGEQTFPFTVSPGYTHIEVSFHASGLGTVGFEIQGPNGTVASEPDYNPANQPCNHSEHSGDAERFAAGPGEYEVTVRNQGILGWLLHVNEVADLNATAHQH